MPFSPTTSGLSRIMEINTKLQDSFVFSSGKNMGVFKGVGYPEEIAEYFGLEQYEGYLWTAHGRFPTNTPGWWGGAHPFGLLDWTVVHNGEISSYGINRRYLEQFGYRCTMQTDTEVIAYAVDLLMRRHGLPVEMGTLWNTGEGGLHPSLYQYDKNTTVQVASGRFGVHPEYLDAARIICLLYTSPSPRD